MKKVKALLILVGLCIVCSCGKVNVKVKTCTLEREDALSTIDLFYDQEAMIVSIQYQFEQVFDDAMVKEMNELEVKTMLEAVFNKNRDDGLKAKVKYSKRDRKANISIDIKLDDFSEEELAYYDLSQNMAMTALMKDLFNLGYQCEENK